MGSEWPLWEVVIRGQHGLNHRHVGSLHAPDAALARKPAQDVYIRRKEGVSVWDVPFIRITASDEVWGPDKGHGPGKVYPISFSGRSLMPARP